MTDTARKFTQSSPEYRAAQSRLSDIEKVADRELTEQREAIKKGTNTKIIAARSQLKALQATVKEYERFASRFERDLEQAPQKYAKATAAQAAFTAALNRKAALEQDYERALIAELRDPARYEVVDPAEVDPSPVAPRKGMLAAIAFIMSLALHMLAISLPKSNPADTENRA